MWNLQLRRILIYDDLFMMLWFIGHLILELFLLKIIAEQWWQISLCNCPFDSDQVCAVKDSRNQYSLIYKAE